METRVKERLVGAVILVALIVLLVPELLSGPKRAANLASTGDNGGSVRTYTIEIGTPEATGAREELTQNSAGQSPMAGAPQSDAPQVRPQVGAPAESPPTVAVTADSPVQAPPRSTGADQPPAVQPVVMGWAVQLGSFSSRENAERLAEELKSRGYKAFVSRFESGRQIRHRVRVGPEQDRARAESLAQRLRREGRQASVVAHP